MLYEDENHITKTALEYYSKICTKFNHPNLAKKCTDLASKIQCDATTECTHNLQTTQN